MCGQHQVFCQWMLLGWVFFDVVLWEDLWVANWVVIGLPPVEQLLCVMHCMAHREGTTWLFVVNSRVDVERMICLES